MFGYRLRSNVADPEEVDIMIKKVYRLLNHILNIDYDIFEPNNKDNWESTLDYFYKYMEVVENEARIVLDQCIDSLKSAEQGLELIAYMGKTETRDKLLQHLMSKRESVMKKFVIEVGIVEHEFLVSVYHKTYMCVFNATIIILKEKIYSNMQHFPSSFYIFFLLISNFRFLIFF